MSEGGLKTALETIRGEIKARFEAQKRVLSFGEYLDLVQGNPRRYTRDAGRYLKDCMDFFGSYEVERSTGKIKRWKLFDLEFGLDNSGHQAELKLRDRLAGNEAAQEAFYRILDGFEREGRANRLVMLHGPNGSAKSTFVACLMRGLEAYSDTEDGALYRFSWIFPRVREGAGIGFATSADELGQGDSFAHLPDERIIAKLQSSVREHPMLLLPRDVRQRLIATVYEGASLSEAAPDWVWTGQLGRKNQQIFQALLTTYRGDLERVLAHIQVERFYISRRYRVGAVTIGPQMSVDASERQITADRSIDSLPASLSALTLFEPYGELVDASGGIVEFSDLLKRPIEAWKYLLLAIENGEVSLEMSNLPINAVMLGSSNELHLSAFRQHPEYNSFRGRMVRIRMPYLLDVHREREIYDGQIIPQIPKHVAPHTTYVAALWSVLTRLRKPDASQFADSDLGTVAASLTPLEKADLLADGLVPARFDADQGKILAGGIEQVELQGSMSSDYEGINGASPREIRMLLLDAAADFDEPCVSPVTFLSRLGYFCDRDDYEFLKEQPDGAYRDHRAFVDVVKERWLDIVESELRAASGLIDERSHLGLFERYVTHVSHWVKKERLFNPVTGQDEDADVDLMKSVEEKLGADDAQGFRNELLSGIAAWAIDHPEQDVDYEALFPRYIEQLRQAYFDDRRGQVGEIGQAIVAMLEDDDTLDEDQREAAQQALQVLVGVYGYERSSAKVALGALVDARYRE
ncbi:MAG: serine protein kinase PrkA [Deltaproteobacteria bacterium]|nr:serine protein kinase PrkA [Deltaproteobacteria bacterium]MBW1874836.1 serine protein kinase PrkA [Deltaproteobacteria bacterium]MBW2210502.1 serine protein kinase PrkA [Deltaproteobacteria bacterium]MBW2213378.1 serine protein kinase PrkA [Deltaproteobacteria bacterium]MBW2378924.1 serine protein kinase PrkA [Deltaproteobacteria bacterium]